MYKKEKMLNNINGDTNEKTIIFIFCFNYVKWMW